ncbi:trans-resveratrol di-O-methyltransferase-like [Abrus precatorius]|uniref:isoflavone 7-O-methyltransferase n=1 Tax=Abrus precatorius TaxID=3816 RepID=A0A8B8JWE0_ABRPR|nr:trans-resveratrol di-O-methyltransferase-like [Abrus precatorius]
MDINQVKGAEELFQAQAHVYNYTYSYIGAMCLKSAVHLGIPDIIYKHGQPITIPELVLALKIHPTKSGHVHRLMRLLVHAGFFATTKVIKDAKEEAVYDLTPSSKLLVKENVPTLSPFVRAMFHPALVHSSEFLAEWFHRDEHTPFHTAFGTGYWDYLSQNQEFNSLFNEAMISDSGMINLVIKDCKSVFEGLNSLVDVGGGKGGVGRIVSESFPNLHWTVLDLPHVVENLSDSSYLKFVGGDMFQSIPSADAILLKLVLHAYSDEDCVKVLKKCREAISSKGKEGKVIIIDIVIGEKNEKHELTEAKLFFDVLMMVLVSGREREEKEWEKLFLEAGFSHYKVTPIFGMRSLIEVYP